MEPKMEEMAAAYLSCREASEFLFFLEDLRALQILQHV